LLFFRFCRFLSSHNPTTINITNAIAGLQYSKRYNDTSHNHSQSIVFIKRYTVYIQTHTKANKNNHFNTIQHIHQNFLSHSLGFLIHSLDLLKSFFLSLIDKFQMLTHTAIAMAIRI
jgi:hypothetical protein